MRVLRELFGSHTQLLVAGRRRMMMPSSCFPPGVLLLGNESRLQSLFDGEDKILLIVAHPIDSALFFGPTLAYLVEAVRNPSSQLYILCITDGEEENESSSAATKSKHIMRTLCSIYNIAEDKLVVFDSPHYRSGRRYYWDIHALRIAVRDLIIREKIQFILSFDELGVDEHKNHKQSFSAIQDLVLNDAKLLESEAGFKEAYELASHRKWLQYTSLLGALWACFVGWRCRRNTNRAGFSILKFAHYKAMLYLLWQNVQLWSWQWLFMMISTYSVYNEFIAIERNPP